MSNENTETVTSKTDSKTRRGSHKRFYCDHVGCEKSFTRLEHLSRHKLNHEPKIIYRCEYAKCPRTFVRKDLFMRHLRKHIAGSKETNAITSSTIDLISIDDWSAKPEKSISEFSELISEFPRVSAIGPTSTDLTEWLFSQQIVDANHFTSNTKFLLFDNEDCLSSITSPPAFTFNSSLSDIKQDELLALIPALKNHPEFSPELVQQYVELYWQNFHHQFPILHRPSFNLSVTAGPLILSVILIGAYYSRASEEFLIEIATPLRWIIFSSKEFHPPTRVWTLQCLLLLETYEKVMARNRMLHERAHIHHGALLQLIRRGATLRNPPLPPPSDDYDSGSWNRWIQAESIKRAVFMAFILDIMHSQMFGHGQLMHPHEMRLYLPCDDAVWNAHDVRGMKDRTEPRIPYLVALKNMLKGQQVKASEIGHLSILCGLISISTEMTQQNLRASIVKWNADRESWIPTMSGAYDFWIKNLQFFGYQDHDWLSSSLSYHFAHISLRVSRYELRVFCGDRSILGLTTLKEDYIASEKYIKEWCTLPSARTAAFHALKALYDIFIRADSGSNPTLAVDMHVHNTMIIAHCAMVYWAYTYCLDGPESNVISDANSYGSKLSEYEWAIAAETCRGFLLRSSCVMSPDDLSHFQNRNHSVGLLKWVIVTLSGRSRHWRLADEMLIMLELCIKKSLGWENATNNFLGTDSSCRLVQVG